MQTPIAHPNVLLLHLQADIAHDNKAAQLDDNVNTLLGLDSNRLCRWDMRDRRGVVQVSLVSGSGAGGIVRYTWSPSN